MDEQLMQWVESVTVEQKQSKPVQIVKMLNSIPCSPQQVDPQDIPPLG